MLGPVAVQVRATVTVREVANADELRACQALQRRAWGITEDGYVVPVATMAAAQRVGGLVLGAFNPDDTLVGFSFSFLGRVRGRLVLYSQLTGVDPEYQGSGIGRAIKLEQRARAAEIGVQAIAWAFDPLQASNAAFNLSVLGAECRIAGPRGERSRRTGGKSSTEGAHTTVNPRCRAVSAIRAAACTLVATGFSV